MKTKFIWLIVSCLMVAALILASCGAPVTEKKEVKGVVKESEKEAEKVDEVEEKVGPQYGGTLTWISEEDVPSFDRVLDGVSSALTNQAYISDTLLTSDWWDDPERKITTFSDEQSYATFPQRWIGSLAESWEWPEPLTMTFHLRKGVRWQNKPPMNGREFVAQDVKWNWEFYLSQPLYSNVIQQNIKEITCPDKYTVVFNFEEPSTLMLWAVGTGGIFFCPPEVYQQGGNLRDWKDHVGTGPFMLTDYVPDSVLKYERNPDYFVKDPWGNQLPYIDQVRALIVLDPAARIAALRTGKVDMTGRGSLVSWDYKASLESTNPELQWQVSPGFWWILYTRTVDAPWDDVKVRQACATAINYEEINDAIFGGTGLHWNFPTRATWPMWTPLDEQSSEIQEIYKWSSDNPEKAKALLAEAGYPNGIDAHIQYYAEGRNAPYGDAIQLVKEYWDAIGVRTTLEPVTSATQSAIKTSKVYEDIFATITGGAEPISNAVNRWGCGGVFNRTLTCDPYIDELTAKAAAEFDVAKQQVIFKELYDYLALQCHHIAMPSLNLFIAWYPWVKQYHGEININLRSDGTVAARIWLDLDLREEMTGRK